MNRQQTQEAGPLVSIIIPVYNIKEYIGTCLRSVCGQTLERLEIIVVDDGSTDGSTAICRDYAARDSRIHLVRQENAGQSAARNAGLRLATGDYVGFVDGDDWIEPDMYASLLEALTEADADIALCAHSVERPDGRRRRKGTKMGRQVLETRQAMRLLAEDKEVRNYAWDKLFRRTLFADGLCFPPRRCFEDVAVMYRLFYKARRVAMTGEVKYHYRVRPGSTMQGRYDPRKEWELFRATVEQNDFYLKHRVWDRTPRFVLARGIHLVDHLLLSADPAVGEILPEVLAQLERYAHCGWRQAGVTCALKRWLICRHLSFYRRAYRAFRRCFKSGKLGVEN